MNNGFTVKDSGKRAQFESGMVRDTNENKTDYTNLLHGPMFDRWAEHLTKAKSKYPDPQPGVPNWTLAEGMEELTRFKESAMRHFRQWMRGDNDEDHAAAVFFNINGAEYVRSKMARGVILPLGADSQPQDRIDLMQAIAEESPVVVRPSVLMEPGYRLISDGEILCYGDEYYVPEANEWVPTQGVGLPKRGPQIYRTKTSRS